MDLAQFERSAVADQPITLVSHALCPYVQRAAIVAAEKGVGLDRIVIDLGNKPDWFIQRSPTGKVPLLMVGNTTLFESAAIAEFLDEISGGGMLPADPTERARHRAWIDFASGTLSEIGALYSATDEASFGDRSRALENRFERIADALVGPWFGGPFFGLVDAAFGPVFRYLDSFEREAGLYLLATRMDLIDWRQRLAARPSVKGAVLSDYPERLRRFLLDRPSYLAGLIRSGAEGAQRTSAILGA
jgi:glutathione S-transferase